LAEALGARVLIETDVDRYAFTHALVRQTLYEELRVPERVRLHRRAGAALEVSADDDRLAELAPHFFEAMPGGAPAKAAAYAARPGRRPPITRCAPPNARIACSPTRRARATTSRRSPRSSSRSHPTQHGAASS